MKVTYSSNNSGGRWWLSDQDWKNLEAGGWSVEWSNYRFLGELATTASKEFSSIKEAIKDWESITNKRATALGCSCCGTPHSFMSDNPYEYWSPEYPKYGEEY